jgi:hypothetical protein
MTGELRLVKVPVQQGHAFIIMKVILPTCGLALTL